MKIKVKAIELDNLLNEQIGLIPKLFRTLKAGGKLIDDLGPLASELQGVRRALSAMKIPRALRGNSADDILRSIFEATPDLQGQMDSVIGTVITSLRNGEAVEIGDKAVEGAVRLRFKGKIKYTDPDTGLVTTTQRPVSIYLTVTKDGVVEGSVGLGKTGSSKSLKAWKANGGRRAGEVAAEEAEQLEGMPAWFARAWGRIKSLWSGSSVQGRLTPDDFDILQATKANFPEIEAQRLETLGGTSGKNVDAASRAQGNYASQVTDEAVIPATVNGKIIVIDHGELGTMIAVWNKSGKIEFRAWKSGSAFIGQYENVVRDLMLPEASWQGVANFIKAVIKSGWDYYFPKDGSKLAMTAKLLNDFANRGPIPLALERGMGPPLRYLASYVPRYYWGIKADWALFLTKPSAMRLYSNIVSIAVAAGGFFKVVAWIESKFGSTDSAYNKTRILNLKNKVYRGMTKVYGTPGLSRQDKIDELNDYVSEAWDLIALNSTADRATKVTSGGINSSNLRKALRIRDAISEELNSIAERQETGSEYLGRILQKPNMGFRTSLELAQDYQASKGNSKITVKVPKSDLPPKDLEQNLERIQSFDPAEADRELERKQNEELSKKPAALRGTGEVDTRRGPEVDTTDADEFVPTPKPDQAIPTTSRLGPGGISDFLDEALSSNDIILKHVKASAKMKVKLTELKNED